MHSAVRFQKKIISYISLVGSRRRVTGRNGEVADFPKLHNQDMGKSTMCVTTHREDGDIVNKSMEMSQACHRRNSEVAVIELAYKLNKYVAILP